MLGEAKRRNPAQQITYRIGSIEGYEYPAERYDVVLSSLALHYVEDLSAVFQKIFRTLRPGGDFVLFDRASHLHGAGAAGLDLRKRRIAAVLAGVIIISQKGSATPSFWAST